MDRTKKTKHQIRLLAVDMDGTCLDTGSRMSRETVEALDIDEQFGLVVRRQDGTQDIIRSGEVSVRGMYGYVE